MTRLHPLHAFTGWLLRRIVRYRVDTVRANLAGAFPDMEASARERILEAFYGHLAKVILQTLSDPSKARMDRLIDYTPSPQVDAWVRDGRTVVATMGHVGNWEWTGAYVGNIYPDHFCALYRRIKNPWLNRQQYARRAKHARYLIESRQTGELIRLLRSTPVVLLMIADQNPGSDQGLAWVPFLQRSTAFTTGPENIALRFGFPFLYLHTLPLPHGRYSFRWEILWDGSSPIGKGELTRRYAEALAANIIAAPHAWLWTHRRWKRQPPDAAE